MKYLKKINESSKQQSFTKKICPTCFSTHNLDVEQIKNIFSDFLSISNFSFGHYTPTKKIGLVSVCHIKINFDTKSTIDGSKSDTLTDSAEVLDQIGDVYSCLKRLNDDGMSFGYRISTSDENRLSMIIFIWETK